MKKYIIFTLFLFTLFFINVFSVSADFSSCPSKTHSWPAETPGSTWSWTVTDRSEMIRGLESISGINSGTTYNASTGVFAGGDPTVFGLSANATTAEIGVLARQWSGIGNKNIDSVLNGFYSTNPQLKNIAMAEILNAVAVVGSASNTGKQYLAELDGAKMTEIYNAYLAAYPTVSKDWINQLWNQMAPTCGKIATTSNVNVRNNTPTPSEPSTKFKIGDTVKSTSSINVRGTPNGNVIDIQKINSYGTVIAGPENVGGYSWWKIDFQTGPDGWSAENFFVKLDTVLPVSSSAIMVSLTYNNSTNPVSVTSGGSVNFNWSATNINKCQMFKNDTLYNDGVYNTYGVNTPSYSGTFYIGNITSSATYVLTCTGASGSQSSSMAVNVVGQNTSLVAGCVSSTGAARTTGFNIITGQPCGSTSATNPSTNASSPQINSSNQAGSGGKKGCYKYPDGSVIAQNMNDSEGNYCVYLAKVGAEQQAKNATRMDNVLAQYPNWKGCAANVTELTSINSKLGYFGDLLWQPPAQGGDNYDLYLKCKDMIGVLQYINQNRFEIHPAVWLYEKGFWIGRSNTGVPTWPPINCDSCSSPSSFVTVSPGNTSSSSNVSSASNVSSSVNFKIGDVVKVKSEVTLNVRTSASTSGGLLGKQSSDAIGTINDGPTKANGYTWWKVDYSRGVDGWSVENYLMKSSSVPSSSTGQPATTAPSACKPGGVPAQSGLGAAVLGTSDADVSRQSIIAQFGLKPDGGSMWGTFLTLLSDEQSVRVTGNLLTPDQRRIWTAARKDDEAKGYFVERAIADIIAAQDSAAY